MAAAALALTVSPLALKATALATSAVLLKIIATSGLQGYNRFKTGYRPPEDQLFVGAKGRQQSYGAANDPNSEKTKKFNEIETRWARIQLNDHENIPIGLITAWGSMLTAYSPEAHAGLVGLFAACRILHTYYYAKSKQPHRGLVWAGGIVAVIGMSLNGLAGLFL
eukprot:Colp12_sorted_trinity150504_noHs@5414